MSRLTRLNTSAARETEIRLCGASVTRSFKRGLPNANATAAEDV